jgi:hypothetical protein
VGVPPDTTTAELKATVNVTVFAVVAFPLAGFVVIPRITGPEPELPPLVDMLSPTIVTGADAACTPVPETAVVADEA